MTAMRPLLRAPLAPALALLLALGAARPARAQAEPQARAARPLSLAEAIALARKGRAEIKQALIEADRTDKGVLLAQLERVHLTLQASFREQYQKLGINGDCNSIPNGCADEAHLFTGTASLNIPLWTGLQVEADISRAHWLDRAARAQTRAAGQKVGLEAARAYWAVRRAELERRVEADTLSRLEEIEQIIRARTATGIAPQLDLNRAHVQLLRQQAQVALLDAQIVQARQQLAVALEIDAPVRLTEDPAAHVPVLPPLAHALELAQGSRPDLEVAQAQLEALADGVRSARGAYWPQIGLFAQASAQNTNLYVNTMPVGEDIVGNFIAGGYVQWTLFDTLSTWGLVADAEAARAKSEADRARQGLLVSADVRTAHAEVQRVLYQRGPLQQAAEVARQNLDILRKRYRIGESLLIELLDGQLQLARAESDLVDNVIAAAVAEAELLSALGRL